MVLAKMIHNDLMEAARNLRQSVLWQSNESVLQIYEALLAAEQRGIERAARLVEILGITDFDAGPEAPGKMISGRVLIDNTPTREETASAIRSLSPKAEG